MDLLVNSFHQNYLSKSFIKFTIFQSLIDCDLQNHPAFHDNITT